MILYNPAFDVYHATYRILLITHFLSQEISIEKDRLKILDFLFLFPRQIRNVRFTKDAIKYRKFIPIDDNPYRRINNVNSVLRRMSNLQESAIRSLVHHNYLDKEKYAEGFVKRTNKEVPEFFTKKIEHLNPTERSILSLLSGPFTLIDFFGKDGFKDRVNLLEYRYDIK